MSKKYWENDYNRNCNKCDMSYWCQNKSKKVCNMELKEGDIINFVDWNSGKNVLWENQTITERIWNGNLSFIDLTNMEEWGINGIFVTDIKIVGHVDLTGLKLEVKGDF